MREIVLIFEGHEDSEKKAADSIQEAIFQALSQERMSIRQFTNQQKQVKEKVAIGTPAQVGRELEIPPFLRKYHGENSPET